MKYKTVFVKPGIGGKLCPYFVPTDGISRPNIKTEPNPKGVYRYPVCMGDRRALLKLKKAMTAEYIDAVLKSLYKLREIDEL